MIAPPAPTPVPAAARVRTPIDVPWLPAVLVGVAVLLAVAPVWAVVAGGLWLGYAAVAVVVVIAAGLLAGPLGGGAVAGAQLAALLVLLTGLFAVHGVLGVLPGPGAFADMATLLGEAADQVRAVPAPVPATPEILFLVTATIGLVAVAAHLAAVTAGAPATAGAPLLVAFAVPTALSDDLLPWWALVAGAAALGLLLVVGAGRRALPGAAALTAAAVALGLLAGVPGGLVDTDGRFGDAPRAAADIGLDPFTALRGQLVRSEPDELLQVQGLPRATYLRALTLRDYVPNSGWTAGRPDPGVPLTGLLPPPPGPGEQVTVEIDNLAYRDYWLPLYGSPLNVVGVDEDLWAYDPVSGIAYTSRPREESGWEQQASLPEPTAAQLRAAGRDGASPVYLDTADVDPRVTTLAAQITAGASTDFDRAIAMVDHFTAPSSQFVYSLSTAPGNGDDALVEFLTVGRVGYCEQYASAMAIMMRTLGAPARVAVGFTGGTADGDERTISTSDAHAWVEVWFAGIGWTLFDPTPLADGRAIQPPYVEEARLDSLPPDTSLGAQRDELPQAVPAPPGQAAPQLSVPGETGDEVPGWADGLPLWPFGAFLVVALLVAAPGLRRGFERHTRLATVAAGGPTAASAAWAELVAESTDRDVPGQRSDTVRATARRMVRDHRIDEVGQAAMREVVGAVEASWYGDRHPEPGALADAVTDLRSGMETGNPIGWRRRLFPRSVRTQLRALVSRH